MFKDLKYIFSPNKTVSKPTILMIIGIQIVLLLTAWYATGELIPKPHEVLNALGNFFKEGELLNELFVSTGLCLEAMGISILISLAFWSLSKGKSSTCCEASSCEPNIFLKKLIFLLFKKLRCYQCVNIKKS